jgi:hypothetical protein
MAIRGSFFCCHNGCCARNGCCFVGIVNDREHAARDVFSQRASFVLGMMASYPIPVQGCGPPVAGAFANVFRHRAGDCDIRAAPIAGAN